MTLDFIEYVLEWVYPPICMACKHLLPINDRRRVGIRLCSHCEDLLEPLAQPLCARCGHPLKTNARFCNDCKSKERSFFFTHNKAAFAYDDLLRDLMHDLKFRSKKNTAAGLGQLWAEICHADDFSGVDYLIPIPLHPVKQRDRGFNQAEIIARPLAERFGIPMVVDLLIRARHTAPQSGLHLRSRAENVHGAFTLNAQYEIKNKKLMLIDDIYTTGASLNECAKVLMRHGAAKVQCMTLSVTLKKKNKSDDN